MLNLKKTAVAVLALGSSAAFAGTMGPVCTATNVTIPCESNGWGFGAKALYLQPTYTNQLSYLATSTSAAGTTLGYVSTSPKWGWGFMIEGDYQFSTGNDLNLNWYHLGDTGTSRVYTAASLIGSDAPSGALAVSNKPTWDAVNLELGQHVDFGDSLSMRFHGGVEYARLQDKFNTAFVTVPDTGASTNNLRYNGFGPRFGMDSMYNWGNGFSVYGNAAGALLVGSNKFTQTFQSTLATAGVVVTQTGSTTQLIPEMEAKLGAAYTYAMAQGDLTLDVGWMWVNYFNVLQYTQFNALQSNESNFGVQGPYIGLKWIGSVV